MAHLWILDEAICGTCLDGWVEDELERLVVQHDSEWTTVQIGVKSGNSKNNGKCFSQAENISFPQQLVSLK